METAVPTIWYKSRKLTQSKKLLTKDKKEVIEELEREREDDREIEDIEDVGI